jgi:hypothetical protein
MSNQIVISSGAKVRALEGVLTGTAGIVNALAINVANGIPQLDGSGKILVSQLPNSVMEYKGSWNAATNTPTLVNGTGNAGDVYLCEVAGTVNFGAGPITFAVGDQVIYSGSIWQRASGATGTVTSVAVTESGDALTITGSPITTNGTINIGFAGNSGQYVNGAGGLTTFPSLTGFVPYTGATANVDLGTFNLTADVITGATGSFASSGGSDTFAINHSSGSGIALNITKGGNGEGLYINKTSGSGNAATIIGTLNATTLVKSGGTSSQFLKADGSVDSNSYITLSSLSATSPIFYNSTTGVISSQAASATLQGFVTTSSQTIAGVKTFSNGIVMDNGSSGVPLEFKQYASSGYSGTGYTSLFALNNSLCINFGNPSGFIILNTTTLTSNRTFTFQNASGTLALTSDLGAYLPLTGGTLTGALSGTSGTFSGNVTSDSLNITSASTSPVGLTITGADETFVKFIGPAGVKNWGFITTNLGTSDFGIYQSTSAGGDPFSAGTPKLYFSGTGAATFSSSVTAGGSLIANTGTGATFRASFDSNNILEVSNYSATSGYQGLQIIGSPIKFYTGTAGAGSASLALTITSGGNVGIGTSSPQGNLEVVGLTYFTRSSQSTLINPNYGSAGTHSQIQVVGNMALAFATNGDNERMRITSGGDLLWKKTSSAASGIGFWMQSSNGDLYSTIANSVNTYHVYDNTNSVYRFYVTGGGTINASNTTISAISDVRLKENITDLEIGLDAIMALRPRKFDWKKESGNNGKNIRGFIAQEFEEVFPDLIDESINPAPEGEEPYKQIRQDLIPILVKAMQQQQAQIEELKAMIMAK